MMRSMFAGVSGLRAHQVMTDVVANNIANVNTIGFKTARVQFADTLSQMLRGGAGSGEATAGINPQQVGLGVSVAATNKSFTQGGSQLTGRPTDVAITGDGFFLVNLGGEELYTRAGSFSFDDQGYLTDPTGGIVQGWNASDTGDIETNAVPDNIRVAINATIPPVATSVITMSGNLDARAVVGQVQSTAIDVIDNLGEVHRMTLEMELTAPNTWDVRVVEPGGATLGTSSISFEPSTGALVSTTVNPSYTFTPAGGTAFTFTLDLGTPGAVDAVTQYAGAGSAQAIDQNGLGLGTLRSFAISDDGTLSGVFSNGETQTLAQLALISFSNPSGLMSAGSNRFRATQASGSISRGVPNEKGLGGIASGTLEMSNVDLSEEFTNLIIAQRGFQANSRIITVSDEMIQELVNLKR